MINKSNIIRRINSGNSTNLTIPEVSEAREVECSQHVDSSNLTEVVVAAFLADQQVMGTSRKAYGWGVRRFFRWCSEEGRRTDSLLRSDIVSYVEWLSMRGYSPKTVEAYTVAVRRFYGWLDAHGKYPNIAQGVKRPRKKEKAFVKMHLDRGERAALMDYARNRGARDFAIINLMLRNGLRTVEVSRLDVGDVTTRRGVRVLKVWRKGSLTKDDFVALTDEAWQPIEEYLATRGRPMEGEPLFATDGKGHRMGRMSARRIQQIVKEGLRAVGLMSRDYSPHSLRHTTAAAILENGGSVYDVQTVLGHASPVTSEIYLRSAEEEMRLRNPPEEKIRKAFDAPVNAKY